MANKNRDKGHRFERAVCNEMKAIGFTKCVTSRAESKRRDDEKVDLMFTEPFNIQCKAYDSNQPNFRTVLEEMPKEDNYNVVFHKVSRKKDIVVMWKEDFYKLIQK